MCAASRRGQQLLIGTTATCVVTIRCRLHWTGAADFIRVNRTGIRETADERNFTTLKWEIGWEPTEGRSMGEFFTSERFYAYPFASPESSPLKLVRRVSLTELRQTSNERVFQSPKNFTPLALVTGSWYLISEGMKPMRVMLLNSDRLSSFSYLLERGGFVR